MTTPEGQTLPGTDVLNNALQQIGAQFDPEWGGFGKAPKFPQAMTLELCLRAHAHNGGDGARTVVTTSLDAMASGGMYDHLGGGFAALLGRRVLDGPPLREDALRPGAPRPHLPARVAAGR